MDAKGKKKDSSEINFVHNDTIHTENVLKERKYEGKNFKFDYTFNMNNCNTYTLIYNTTIVYPYAEKPQLVHPCRPFTSNDTVARQSKREYLLDKNPISEAFAKDRISKIITQNQQIPKDKYEFPVTSAHEIGWYSKPLVDNSRWNYPVSSTPISQYVDNYYVTMKINPFKLPTHTMKFK